MKKIQLLLALMASLFTLNISYCQVAVEIHPVLGWISDITVPGSGPGFMDYTDDDMMSAMFVSDAPPEKFLMFSTNPDGSNNYAPGGWSFDGLQLGGIYNDGITTIAAATDPIGGTILIIILDNDGESILASFSTPIPTGYQMVEMVDMEFSPLPWATFPSSVVTISTVLNTTTGKQEILTTRIGINPLGYSFGATQTGSVIIASRNSVPNSLVIDDLNNIYVWGTVDRNAAGTTHDCFLLKLNPDLFTLFSKLHSSYTGRDDIATGLALDGAGNLFGVANSQNNTAPYYDHGAVFKLNKINGKRIFLKRIGVYDLGDTGTHEVRADYCGNGIAITGNTPNATNHDTRTWRMDASGNILWSRVINLDTAPGTFETGSNLTFCEVTCDVIIIGYRQCAYPMCGGVYITRYNSTTGATVWGPEMVEIYDYNISEISQAQINYGTVDNSIYLSVQAFNEADETWHLLTAKYDQVVLRSDEINFEPTEIHISPNPVQNAITINNVPIGSQVQIVDLNGKIVSEYITSENATIDVSKLVAGMYYLRVVSNVGNYQTAPFIKM